MQAIHDRRGRTFVWPRNNVNVEHEHGSEGGGEEGLDVEEQASSPEPTLLQTWGHLNICLQHVHRESNQSQRGINIRPNSPVIGWAAADYGVCQRTHARASPLFIPSLLSFLHLRLFWFQVLCLRWIRAGDLLPPQTGLWQSGRNHKPAACLMSSQSICRRRIDLLSEFLKNKCFCQGNNKELRENITTRAM